MDDPMSLIIRPATPDDAHGIARTFLDSAEHHAALDPERYLVPSVEIIAERYRSLERLPGSPAAATTLVAVLAGEIAGFVDVHLDRSPDPMHRDITYCHVAEIAVSNRHQNQGIGRELLTAAEQWGRRAGAAFASLEYHVANHRASAFYRERMGYTPAAVIAIKRL